VAHGGGGDGLEYLSEDTSESESSHHNRVRETVINNEII